MSLDAAMLARVQFAFTVSFHIIFPTTSLATGSDPALQPSVALAA